MKEIEVRLIKNKKSGFTLLEMAVVMAIMGILLMGLVSPFSAQKESENISRTDKQLNEIKDAIMGFLRAQGRLPCPAFPTINPALSGRENVGANTCLNAANQVFQHGFVPGNTLGLKGTYNADGLLLDPWNNPYRYSITRSNGNGGGKWDFIDIAEMRAVGINNLLTNNPILVCAVASPNAVDCNAPAGNSPIVSAIPLVFFSMGKNWENLTSPNQLENAGETGANIASTATALTYPIATDDTFASSVRSGANPNTTFDDLVYWISPNEIYSALYQAGQLP